MFTTTSLVTFKATAIACLICFILGGVGGIFVWDKVEAIVLRHQLELAQVRLEVEQKKPPVKIIETIQGSTETKIVYVPKEKTIIKEVNTGRPIEATEKTDLDARINKTDFTLKVNGREVTFSKDDAENFMFEKNKIQLDQHSKVVANVDLTKTVDALVDAEIRARSKRFSIGAWYLRDGPAASFGIRRKSLEYNIIKGFGKNNDFTGGGIVHRF